MANCKDCKEKYMEVPPPESVPYRLYEEMAARHSMQTKRLIWAIIIAIVLAFATNVGWLIYESQYETIDYAYDYSQDGEGTNIIGDGNEVIEDGTETQGESES